MAFKDNYMKSLKSSARGANIGNAFSPGLGGIVGGAANGASGFLSSLRKKKPQAPGMGNTQTAGALSAGQFNNAPAMPPKPAASQPLKPIYPEITQNQSATSGAKPAYMAALTGNKPAAQDPRAAFAEVLKEPVKPVEPQETEVQRAQRELNEFREAEGLAERGIKDKVIPLEFMTGQLASQRDYANQREGVLGANLSSARSAEAARQEAERANTFELGEGQARYRYNPETGQTEIIAQRAKTYAPGSGGGSSRGLGGIYDQLDYRTANAVLGQADKFGTSDIVKRYNDVIAASNLIAGVNPNTTNPAEHQAVIYNFAKALDPESVVREGEYATVKKYSQSLIKKYGGEIRQAVNGKGFLSPEAIKAIQIATDNRINAFKPQYENYRNETARRINQISGANVADTVLLDYGGGYQPNSQSSGGDAYTSPLGNTYKLPF